MSKRIKKLLNYLKRRKRPTIKDEIRYLRGLGENNRQKHAYDY